MDFSNCPEYSICSNIKTDNGIGGFVEVETELFKVKGYLDLLSGDERTTNNTFMEESTHVLIAEYRNDISSKKHWVIDNQGIRYDITLVDDPMNMHHHLEIYLKFNGDK